MNAHHKTRATAQKAALQKQIVQMRRNEIPFVAIARQLYINIEYAKQLYKTAISPVDLTQYHEECESKKVQDEKFRAAMQKAIESGLERQHKPAPASDSIPKFIRPTHTSQMGSPAGMCSDWALSKTKVWS